MVKLMVNWHRDSTGWGVQGAPKAIYEGFIGKIGICIIVNMFISSEMFIGLT